MKSAQYVRRRPAIARLFLIAIGTPAYGRGSSGPISPASASASSANKTTKALSSGLRASMASSEACTTSRADSSPKRTIPARTSTGRNMKSGMDGAYVTIGGMSTTAQPSGPDTSDVQSGLEGVVAFATTIAEPDKAGGALRYRGVDIEDLVGVVPYEKVWGLLVAGHFEPGLPPAAPHPLTIRSGDPRVDVQSALAMLAPEWGF